MFKRWLTDTSGATSTEYCLIAGVISIAVVAGATSIGRKLFNLFVPIDNGIH